MVSAGMLSVTTYSSKYGMLQNMAKQEALPLLPKTQRRQDSFKSLQTLLCYLEPCWQLVRQWMHACWPVVMILLQQIPD